MIVFRKRDQSANRRPPSLVDVSRAVTVGQGGRRGDSGPACASVSFAAVAAPGPRPGCTSSQWPDLRRRQPVPTR